MRTKLMTVLMIVALLAPNLAFAQDWEASFPAEAAGTYLHADGQEIPAEGYRVIVVPAGTDVDASEAAAALRAALKGSAQTAVVMDAASLGDVAAESDTAIVEKARSLPVDRIVIVRVFAADEPADQTTVVTFYDSQGESTNAFTTKAGDAIDALVFDVLRGVIVEEGSGGIGVSAEAVEAVEGDVQERDGDVDAARRRFEEGYVTVGYDGQPRRGKYGEEMEWEEFYQMVDRPDLADSYSTGEALGTGLVVSGIALTTLGLAATTVGFINIISCEADQPLIGAEDCWTTGNAVLLWGGLASGALLGPVVTVVGGTYNPHPVSDPELRRLIGEYNESLAADAGLGGGSGGGIVPGLGKGMRLNPTLRAYDGGAGVGLRLTY